MSDGFTPVATFLKKESADRVRDLLERAGLNATVRAADDIPSGWRNRTGPKGYVIWVQGADAGTANKVCRKVMLETFPPRYCELCGNGVATHHITTTRAGATEEQDLCHECFRRVRNL